MFQLLSVILISYSLPVCTDATNMGTRRIVLLRTLGPSATPSVACEYKLNLPLASVFYFLQMTPIEQVAHT